MLIPLVLAVSAIGALIWADKKKRAERAPFSNANPVDKKTVAVVKSPGPLGSTTHAAVRKGDLAAAHVASQMIAGRGAPPLDSAGYLGHTDILGAKFWGLPMDVIWSVEYAFVNGDPKVIAFAATKVAKYPKFKALAAEIAQAAKDRA